ncbi:ester cyclase [uncultured Chryseobacterium sp.]|uniref:ester cyclase n=1 Tax=uncultured Chryseobacterium sp. TaxID=259322 RepID=UPI003749A0F3
MDTLKSKRELIRQFITDIWNENRFDLLTDYIHADFVDHSLPTSLAPNADGLKSWIIGTGKSFKHRSVIEKQVTENDKSMIKFRMYLKHIGIWRNIEPAGAEVSAIGYRYFKIKDGKIIEHWALLDGNSIENQLKDAAMGCKSQD